MLNEIISLFYPQLCAGCKKHIHKSDWSICLTCRVRLPQTKFLELESNPSMQLLNGKCELSHAFAFYYFEKNSIIQNLIHALKYEGNIQVGNDFGEIIGQALTDSTLYKDIDFVIPVPLHVQKKRIRGYNQCDSIAEGIAKKIEVKLEKNAVKRIRATLSQTRKNHYERHINAERTFRIEQPELFEGKNVLIIDDVITTGSTLSALIHEFNQIEGCNSYAATIAIAT